MLVAGGVLAAAGAVAGGYGLVQAGALPGKYQLASALGECGAPPPVPTGPRPIARVAEFWSAYRKQTVRMVTLMPPAAERANRISLAVALHGTGGDAVGMAQEVGPAMTAAGIGSLAVVTVDGGNTYWHKRADGDDPVGMILHEVLPRAAAAGLPIGRIGLVGQSMGGYGALLLAARLSASAAASTDEPTAGPSAGGLASATNAGQPTAAVVAALSPAIFATYANARSANVGAFDGPADFAANQLQTRLTALRRVPAWIGVGSNDPFEAQVAALRGKLARLTGHELPGGILPGCHDAAFFERTMPVALRYLAGQL